MALALDHSQGQKLFFENSAAMSVFRNKNAQALLNVMSFCVTDWYNMYLSEKTKHTF